MSELTAGFQSLTSKYQCGSVANIGRRLVSVATIRSPGKLGVLKP